jgi:hypothetical protein
MGDTLKQAASSGLIIFIIVAISLSLALLSGNREQIRQVSRQSPTDV